MTKDDSPKTKNPTNVKTPEEKLLDSLSVDLGLTVSRQQKLTTAIKTLSEMKNNPIDAFGDPLPAANKKEIMDKCKKILGDN